MILARIFSMIGAISLMLAVLAAGIGLFVEPKMAVRIKMVKFCLWNIQCSLAAILAMFAAIVFSI